MYVHSACSRCPIVLFWVCSLAFVCSCSTLIAIHCLSRVATAPAVQRSCGYSRARSLARGSRRIVDRLHRRQRLLVMSSLTDTTDTVTIDTTVPTDEAGQPLIWDGNPARVLGLLHECSEYFLRMGQHQPAITMRAALLSNGKLAVESVTIVPFILGTLTEPDRSLLNMAPPPNERILEYSTTRRAPPPAHGRGKARKFAPAFC